MAKNLCGKTVKRAAAYEVWTNSVDAVRTAKAGDAAGAVRLAESDPSAWTWFVLKKYAGNDDKAFARWFCDVVSPIVGKEGELGDTYVADVKRNAVRIK